MQKRELEFVRQGINYIAGIDEAGRGTWAGPVVAAAIILPVRPRIYGIADSKQLQQKKREELAKKIQESAIACGIGIATHTEIDHMGIAPANRLAMIRAVQALSVTPEHILIDAFALPELSYIPQTAIIKGDVKVYSIAAASIIAKVTRDQIMREFDEQYTGYGFSLHKGYGTAAHRAALKQYGLSSIHRRSFQPMKSML